MSNVWTATIPGARITSPNKVIWSRAAALAGSSKRKRLRAMAGLATAAALGVHRAVLSGKFTLRLVVTMTRVAPRPFDFDNMVAGFKPVRDGIADTFGLRDDHPRFVWQYQQRRGNPREYALEIQIQARGRRDGGPRRRLDPAVLRTRDLFTGRTALEEAEAEARDMAPEIRADVPRNLVTEAEDCAVRWLGMDVFHEGDDIKVAVHHAGHAVMVLVDTHPPGGAPCSTRTIKLSRAQWAKLKTIVGER